jgi:predicted N-acetyltransferase YhbS
MGIEIVDVLRLVLDETDTFLWHDGCTLIWYVAVDEIAS